MSYWYWAPTAIRLFGYCKQGCLGGPVSRSHSLVHTFVLHRGCACAVADMDNLFYHAKDKAVADELIEFLENLAPGAAAKARAETKRIANLSEEEYAKEFPDEFPEEGHEEEL